MKKIILLAVIALAVLIPVLSFAQLDQSKNKLDQAVGGTGLQGDLSVSISTVIKGVLSVVGTIFLLLTIYAGVLWMTAQGKEESVEKAKNIISASVIGLVIIVAAYAITSFVTSKLGV